MSAALRDDLKRLKVQAFDRVECAKDSLTRFHALKSVAKRPNLDLVRNLYDWMFVPVTLWPLHIQDVFSAAVSVLENKEEFSREFKLLIEFLPDPPNSTVCDAVIAYEYAVAKGAYENQVKALAKYRQTELSLRNNPELRRQWEEIKATHDVTKYQDHKGVIRRTLVTERNLRPWFSVDLQKPPEVFQATFDAFCLRWNLFGMQHDDPLLLKLAVNLTPFGTSIHIPAYWSFDPKRDINWEAVTKLHRARVPGRQGAALAEGVAERMRNAEKLRQLDQEAKGLGIKGEKRHEFLCKGLGWDVRTSPRRISRLREEFTNRKAHE